MRLLILAGGIGSRLKPAVSSVPKALAPINGTPFLRLQLENWISQGVRHFTFLLHHQAEVIVEFLNDEKLKLPEDCSFDWVTEPSPLDTGGAVAYSLKRLNIQGDFLVTNGDTWLNNGFSSMMAEIAPSIAVVRIEDIGRYGAVCFDEKQQITEFKEKSLKKESGWINAGILKLNVELFKEWDNQPLSIEREILPKLVEKGALKATPLNANFIDIGVPEDYYRFCDWVSCGQKGNL
jgi:D-glycero-alpha-D-manno-heptose 1-phosphate guanylyltransferase